MRTWPKLSADLLTCSCRLGTWPAAAGWTPGPSCKLSAWPAPLGWALNLLLCDDHLAQADGWAPDLQCHLSIWPAAVGWVSSLRLLCWACQLQLLAGHLTCSFRLSGCRLNTWPAAVGLEAVGWARSYLQLQLSAERSYLQLSVERSYLQLSAERFYLQLSVTQQTRPLMQVWQSMATSTSFPTHPTSAGIGVLL